MNRRTTLVMMILLVAWAQVACGDGKGDTLGLGDRDLDRCSLITAAEAEQWLGSPLNEPAPSEGIDGKPDPVTCLYENEEDFMIVLVQVYDGAVYFAEPGSASRIGETIEDLGEDAWLGDGSVSFLQDEWTASVSRIAGRIADEDLIEMARLISSRLPA